MHIEYVDGHIRLLWCYWHGWVCDCNRNDFLFDRCMSRWWKGIYRYGGYVRTRMYDQCWSIMSVELSLSLQSTSQSILLLFVYTWKYVHFSYSISCLSLYIETCPQGKALFRESRTLNPIRCTVSMSPEVSAADMSYAATSSIFSSITVAINHQCPPSFSCQSYMPDALQGFCCSSHSKYSIKCVMHIDCFSNLSRSIWIFHRRWHTNAACMYIGYICYVSDRIQLSCIVARHWRRLLL